MHQGPAFTNLADGKYSNKCDEDELRHWKPIHMFRDEHLRIKSLRDKIDSHQDNKEAIAKNLVLLRYHDNGYNSIFGKKYYLKLCPDAVTDVITEEHEISSNEDVAVMARDVFGYEIKDKIKIFEQIR